MIKIRNGSFFKFSRGAQVVPENINVGEEITIKMHFDRDPVSGELIFSFGPSGCQFDPPAKRRMPVGESANSIL